MTEKKNKVAPSPKKSEDLLGIGIELNQNDS